MRSGIVVVMLLAIFCYTQSNAQEQNHTEPEPVVNPTDVPVTQMKTWLLVVKDGKPHYKALDGTSLAKENYILFDVKYEHPDGVEPFTFTTAVATFKAKDGFYFDKRLTLNQTTLTAENSTGFKRVNSKTVEVYLTAFTGAMGHDVRISPAMKEYKDKISKIHMIPVATAKMNTPLFDYWSKKDRWGEDIVDKFVAKNMRAYYAYPTTEEYFDINGKYVKDAKKSSYPSNYTILSVDILDEDLSDDIPGLIGEWCLVDGKKFIPKACLKDIKSGSKYSDGAPAVKWALDKAIISGTTFSPEKTCTRVELITLLWNAAGSPKMSGANPFSDVKSTDSHYDAALWASEKGIVSASTFASDTSINRGELVISLWKYLGCPEGLQANQYLDIESHQSDFGRAVAWSNISGVMGGTRKYKFSPETICTKAQVINYVSRALK